MYKTFGGYERFVIVFSGVHRISYLRRQLVKLRGGLHKVYHSAGEWGGGRLSTTSKSDQTLALLATHLSTIVEAVGPSLILLEPTAGVLGLLGPAPTELVRSGVLALGTRDCRDAALSSEVPGLADVCDASKESTSSFTS